MSPTWNPGDVPESPAVTPAGWLLVLLRGGAILFLLLVGTLATLLLRSIEAPLFKTHRPMTPYITQWVARLSLIIMGIRFETRGERMAQPGAVVANHVSWLDIFVLNARKRIYFVSKAEVAGWPGIGFLARMVGTVFIARDRTQAKTQTALFESRLLAGHKLLFFPEGTSTDGLRVLPFKPTLFEAFLSPNLRQEIYVQPVSLIYQAPPGQDARFYGWWGDMALGPHLLQVLAAPAQGSATVVYHAPVRVADFAERKALAAQVEAVVRGGMPEERQIT